MVGILPVLLAGFASSSYSHPTKPRDPNSYHNDVGVLEFVNPLIGTYGTTPNGNGGMIPSVCPPFGMTRWTPQTRENFISQVPYGDSDRLIHGFQATHQPAIWMGEAGQVVLTPGMGEVQPLFQNRGLEFRKQDEHSTPYVYEILVDADQKLDRNWNATAEAVGDGPVPGGAGAVPDDVEQGANGRTRKRQVYPDSLCSRDEETYERSIQVLVTLLLRHTPACLMRLRLPCLPIPMSDTFGLISMKKPMKRVMIVRRSPGFSFKRRVEIGLVKSTSMRRLRKSLATTPSARIISSVRTKHPRSKGILCLASPSLSRNMASQMAHLS